jgi:putative hemolysin
VSNVVHRRGPVASWLQGRLVAWSGLGRLMALGDRLTHLVTGERDARIAALRFIEQALVALDVRYQPLGEGAEVPAAPAGPLLVVANHPYGGLEGLMLLHWLLQSRGDVRLLANAFLADLEPLRPYVIPVDVFAAQGAATAAQRNAVAMRTAARTLEDGGALLMFPAGEVAHLRGQPFPVGAAISDPPWRLGAAHLLRKVPAMVLPVWVDGQNSAAFQAAGLLHPRLRTALLPTELLNKGGRCVTVRIGRPVPPARWQREDGPQGVVDLLRLRAAMLAAPVEAVTDATVPASTPAELALAVPPEAMAAEIAALPADRRLVDAGRFQVFEATAAELPLTLREIGRLRELTFRAVGEGTGRALDLDRFDEHYRHLVLWEGARREVVGAYRLVAVDEARALQGRDGLYTGTLFQWREPALALLGRAVELGRSFIRPEYQRQHLPLLLLWRGLASHLMQVPGSDAGPGRRLLFGAASVSATVNPVARAAITEWLSLHRRHSMLAPLVVGRTPDAPVRWPRGLRAELRHCRDVEALDRLVADLDPASDGLPPLLRQYLRLGARFVASNRDADFAGALDILVVLDVARIPERTLSRLVGAEAASAWLQRLNQTEIPVISRWRSAIKVSQTSRIT